MAMDTVNGHSLPTDGNINTLSGSAEMSALVAAARIFAAAINTDGEVDSSVAEGALAIEDSTASALTVGANGSTNPVLKVNASSSAVATGIQIQGLTAGSGVSVCAISTGADENLLIDAKGAGTITLNSIATGNVNVNSPLVVADNTAAALSVGANGSTNPVLKVNAASSACATGILIQGLTAGSGVSVGAISTGAAENLTVDAKGTGTITLNGTATGAVTIGSSLAFGSDASAAKQIAIGTTNGLKIGTAAGQKISVYGVTPVVQGVSAGAQSLSVVTISIQGLTVAGSSYGAEYGNLNTLVGYMGDLNTNLESVITALNKHDVLIRNFGISL